MISETGFVLVHGGIQGSWVWQELIADIRQADLRDVVLVGHSQAGTIVPTMVHVAPDLFRHAVYEG